MRKTFFLSIIAIMGLVMHSCAPDPVYSYPPEFKKPLLFTLDDPKSIVFNNQNNIETVTSCKPGDSITVYLPTAYTGVNIYKTIYQWTSKEGLLGSKTITQIAPCELGSLPPKWTFKAPLTPGRYEVYFRASFYYSAQTEQGFLSGSYPPNNVIVQNGTHIQEDRESSVSGTLIVME